MSELAAVADTDPAPFAEWHLDRSVVRALWLMIALQHGHAEIDARAALVEIDALGEVVGSAQPHAQMIETARTLALYVRSRDDLDLSGMAECGSASTTSARGWIPGLRSGSGCRSCPPWPPQAAVTSSPRLPMSTASSRCVATCRRACRPG